MIENNSVIYLKTHFNHTQVAIIIYVVPLGKKLEASLSLKVKLCI
jgi:hypothetical protein